MPVADIRDQEISLDEVIGVASRTVVHLHLGALCLWTLPDVFPGSILLFGLLWGALMVAIQRRWRACLRQSALRNERR